MKQLIYYFTITKLRKLQKKYLPYSLAAKLSNEIIGITFITDGSKRDEDLLKKLNIIEHEEMISINIDKKNVIGTNLKLERDTSLSWMMSDKALYIVFSDFNESVHSYYIGNKCKMLLNENSDIQGIVFVF